MSIESVSGRTYGPFPYSTARAAVGDYIRATGDDPTRWREAAPRSLAGSMLFVVAPALLADPDAAEAAGSVIHGEQTFQWLRPIPLDAELTVTGTVTRIRERSGLYFVGFELMVAYGGEQVVTGTSMFLMSASGAPAGGAPEEVEPAAGEGSVMNPPDPAVPVGDQLPPLVRAASRADLVRYAAASHDFNPIHWDHTAAISAGLPGVVVHGLLQSAWLTQAVERVGSEPVSARFRYRAPLRPAVPVKAVGIRTVDGWETSLVSADGVQYVVGGFVGGR